MPRHFQSKQPWTQQPPSFVFIILLTAFYTAFNKPRLPAFHSDWGGTWVGGGEKWSTNPLAGEISPDGEAVYFFCPKKPKVALRRKLSPPILGARLSLCNVMAPSSHLEGKTGSTTGYSAPCLLVLFKEQVFVCHYSISWWKVSNEK